MEDARLADTGLDDTVKSHTSVMILTLVPLYGIECGI